MMGLISLVGRTRFELVTNGLKARYALPAQYGFPLCAIRIAGLEWRFSPAFCQKSPTCRSFGIPNKTRN